jgi:uncharacterized protein YgiM (DUF1202 family)
MKYRKLICVTVVLLFLSIVAVRTAEQARIMSVQVKSTSARESPAFVSKAVATLSYGDRLEITDTQGVWTKVKLPEGALSGWVHSSALTPKRIVLKSGQETAQTRASGDELALAGKGFNSDVEAEFKRQHQNIDFSWIDKMEKIKIQPEEMDSFLKEGAVAPKEGGAQ